MFVACILCDDCLRVMVDLEALLHRWLVKEISVLRRLKNYIQGPLHVQMENYRLAQLLTLALENELFHDLSTTQDFVDRVIDKFAAIKTRKLKLVFRKYI